MAEETKSAESMGNAGTPADYDHQPTMTWYYVAGGQQAGPVSEADFEALIQTGQIQAETLVWKEGMANWQPLREVRTAAVAPITPGSFPAAPEAPGGVTSSPLAANAPVMPAANQVPCVECGRVFPIEDTIAYGNARVCANCKPAFLQKLSEGVQINTGTVYASFWLRVGAKLLDGLILRAINFPLGFAIGLVAGKNPNQTYTFMMMQALIIGVAFVIGVAYSTFFLGKYGATPGKMICKIKVISADGSRLTYGKAFGRFWAEILSGCPTLMIGYLIAASDPERRALHDRICNTRVVMKNQ
jgi:uncharacterized RDD family membrane protein YckC